MYLHGGPIVNTCKFTIECLLRRLSLLRLFSVCLKLSEMQQQLSYSRQERQRIESELGMTRNELGESVYSLSLFQYIAVNKVAVCTGYTIQS